MKEGKIYLHIECKECLNRQQAGHLAVLAAKEEDWQLKYDLLIADYEQKWGLSMRQDEQIAALTEKLEFYRKNRTVRRLDALTAENKWLREMERIGKLMGFLIELNLGACGFIYSYILDETGKARDAAIEFMKEAKCSDQ